MIIDNRGRLIMIPAQVLAKGQYYRDPYGVVDSVKVMYVGMDGSHPYEMLHLRGTQLVDRSLHHNLEGLDGAMERYRLACFDANEYHK